MYCFSNTFRMLIMIKESVLYLLSGQQTVYVYIYIFFSECWEPRLDMSYNRPYRLAIVKILVESGAGVNICLAANVSPLLLVTKEKLDSHSNYDRHSTFHHKVEEALPILRFLLASGAKPNMCEEGTTSPLLKAVALNWKDAVECLLEYNADVNHIGPSGKTALNFCCENQGT